MHGTNSQLTQKSRQGQVVCAQVAVGFEKGKRCEDQDGNVFLDTNCVMVKRKKTEQEVVSA